MTAIRLALSELKRMTGGVFPKLVMVALACVPLLYGGIYLYSNWDPYGKVDHVSGAIVMEDAGGKGPNGQQMNTGQSVKDKLHDSGNFDWHDVSDRDTAVDQVTKGETDFAIVIPKDFTQRLLSTSKFAPDQNGKPGTVDPQQAGLEIVTNDANNYLLTNIVAKAGTTIRDQVASEVGDQTAQQMLANFTDIHQQMSKATDGSQKVSDGAVNLSSAVNQLKDGTSSLASGAQQLNEGAHSLVDGENQLVDGNAQAVSGAKQLDDGAQQLNGGATTLAQGTQGLADGSAQLKDGTSTLAGGSSQLADGTSKLSDGAGQLSQGVSSLNQQVQESGIQNLGNDLTTMCRDLSSVNTSEPSGRLGSDVSNAVVSEVGSATTEQVNALVKQGILTQDQADKVVASVSGQATKDRVANAATGQLDSVENTDQAAALQKLRDSSCASDGTSTVAGKISQLTGGIAQLNDGAAGVADGAKNANDAAQQLSSGASTLDQKTGELADGATKVNDGAQSLKSGAGTLAGSTGQLVQGSQTLYDNQVSARDGAQKLADGTDQAVQGSSQVDEGAGQIQGGSGQLVDGSQNLTKGLRDGTNKVPNLDEKQQSSLASVMSDPVTDDHNSLASARNYGEGMGPFFIVLALWIGVLMSGQFLRASNSRALASGTSSFRVALGSWGPFAVVSVAQTVVLFAVVLFGLGFEMTHPWLTFWFLLLTSMTFSALGQGLISLFGSPGKLMVLILLIVQLVTCGGMMPYETLPEPLKWLHHVLPMGYALTGVRRLAYGINEGSVPMLVLILVGFLILGVAISLLGSIKSRTWTLAKLHPEVEL
ncbi:YhgE/Pip domain-containing protein [Kocuria sp. HSID16901]|uniref:YhgE/Pip domain-containing protein n=1 Tax=Kocuria sp. HSID16901 TaxID=2419505 RepID=UPI000660A856|nr:YhgE/Pip domain-containing protein [Kocuria sp. HSID16901]MCT1368107.1 YhgE/Pip domain-containing protein [Rothia sp. p3-SID1597]RUQ23174.1 YhgE/Pip domain-containing protein [Kocuria sp. HSID16901]